MADTFYAAVVWPWLEGNPILATAVIAAIAYGAQRFLDHRRRAKVAVEIAARTLDYLIERLDAAIQGNLRYALRGARTAEMVEVMREVDISSLPARMITAFSYVRADTAAINARISEVFAEKRNPDLSARAKERREALKSSCYILHHALEQYQLLQVAAKRYTRERHTVCITPEILAYMAELGLSQGPARR